METNAAPTPIATPRGAVRFAEETTTISPEELGQLFEREQIYWAVDRTAAEWRRLLESSRLFVARLEAGGELVGTLRLWSDGVYEAKIYDVLVAEPCRAYGIASALVAWALRDPWVTAVKAVVLETRDAEAFYRRFGFVTAREASLVHLRRG
jgi:predicted GNAT family N-acyltransferase